MHNQYLMCKSTAVLHWDNSKGNTRVVISSHGATAYNLPPIPKIPLDLHFAATGNRTTHGKVSSICAMTSQDFLSEPSGTSNVDEHTLTWYQHDTNDEIEYCLANGFDVVTIKQSFQTYLGHVLIELAALSRYHDGAYGLFCRVPSGQKMVKVLPVIAFNKT